MGNAQRSPDKNVRIRTYMPVLKTCMSTYAIANVLEFGMGLASTLYFLEQQNVQKLVSVETSNEWINLCKSNSPKHSIIHLEKDTYKALDKTTNAFDLILSDGIGIDRLACTKAALLASPIVIEHDTEVWTYDDQEQRRSNNHVMLRYDIQNPETTVWIATSLNIQSLLNIGCKIM